VVKREIHLIYDMICDEKLIENLLQDRINLVLKENLFSLKNLCEIYDGSLMKFIEKCKKYLVFHIDICKVNFIDFFLFFYHFYLIFTIFSSFLLIFLIFSNFYKGMSKKRGELRDL